jgi:hypothetical protein
VDGVTSEIDRLDEISQRTLRSSALSQPTAAAIAEADEFANELLSLLPSPDGKSSSDGTAMPPVILDLSSCPYTSSLPRVLSGMCTLNRRLMVLSCDNCILSNEVILSTLISCASLPSLSIITMRNVTFDNRAIEWLQLSLTCPLLWPSLLQLEAHVPPRLVDSFGQIQAALLQRWRDPLFGLDTHLQVQTAVDIICSTMPSNNIEGSHVGSDERKRVIALITPNIHVVQSRLRRLALPSSSSSSSQSAATASVATVVTHSSTPTSSPMMKPNVAPSVGIATSTVVASPLPAVQSAMVVVSMPSSKKANGTFDMPISTIPTSLSLPLPGNTPSLSPSMSSAAVPPSSSPQRKGSLVATPAVVVATVASSSSIAMSSPSPPTASVVMIQPSSMKASNSPTVTASVRIAYDQSCHVPMASLALPPLAYDHHDGKRSAPLNAAHDARYSYSLSSTTETKQSLSLSSSSSSSLLSVPSAPPTATIMGMNTPNGHHAGVALGLGLSSLSASPPPSPLDSRRNSSGGDGKIRPMAFLCLDGGGVRGLMEIEMLMELERRTGRRINDMVESSL